MTYKSKDDSLVIDVIEAIHTGDVTELKRILSENPSLKEAKLMEDGDSGGCTGQARTLLHIATDWPGHFPNNAATVKALLDAGADVNARFIGPHSETPLHWAASSNDIKVLDTLLDAGANIEAQGGVIADGTPLDDAVAFGQWQAAHRLVRRGARTQLWHAAALGLMDRLKECFKIDPSPNPSNVTNAFWHACNGGQRQAAEFLLKRGAELDWKGYDSLTPLDAARRINADGLVEWLRGQGARSANEIN